MELPLIVGIDGSDSSLVAVDWAVDEAARHGLPLRLVYASLWERYEGVAPSGSVERPSEQVLADDIVGSAAERARRRNPEVKVSTEVVPEEAASALLREGHNASALVTGSRGRGELTGLLLGSVSLAVASRAHCPVIVVRGDKAGLAGTHERI
ncbi:universal stress protein, partial [Streptomyces ureilyticus]